MELFLTKMLNSLLQIVLFSLVPLIWWLLFARKKASFLPWLGLKGVLPENKRKCCLTSLAIAAGFILLSVAILFMMRDVATAASEFAGMGFSAFPAALVYAFFNTALPEEILFRGFLLKRLASKFSFGIANAVQGSLFGLLHGILFFSSIGIVQALIVIIFTGAVGWCMGYVNEKKANGSLLPSWLVHGAANLFSAIIAMFSIL